MERVCEPELMDDRAQALAYAAADFSASDATVLQRLEQLLAPLPELVGPQGLVLDLGCGPGNIAFLLAERYPQCQVLGMDGAAAMLDLARERRDLAPEAWPQLQFQQMGLPLSPAAQQSLGPWAGHGTVLVSNSLLHHLHDPQVLWASLRPLAAPGALVYMRDLRRPASLEEALALRERHLPEAPPVLRHDYLASLQAAFRPEEVAQQLQAAGLRELQVAALEDRYLEVWGQLA